MKSRTRSMLAKRRRRTGHRRAGIKRRILERWGNGLSALIYDTPSQGLWLMSLTSFRLVPEVSGGTH